MKLIRTFMASLLLMAAGGTATAQTSTAQYDYKVLTCVIDHYFVFDTEGVNLRSKPTTAAGKLMVWNSDGGSIDTEVRYFMSDENRDRLRANSMTGAWIDAFHPGQGDMMYQLDERNGWVELFGVADWDIHRSVYTMKKFGHELTLDKGHINGSDIKEVLQIPDNAKLVKRDRGAFRRYPVFVWVEEPEYDDEPTVRVVAPMVANLTYVSSISKLWSIETGSSRAYVETKEMESDMDGDTYTMEVVHVSNQQSAADEVIAMIKSMSDEQYKKTLGFEETEVSPMNSDAPMYVKCSDGKMHQLPIIDPSNLGGLEEVTANR